MLPFGAKAIYGADIIIFGKLASPRLIRALRIAAPDARFVLITPYRPVPPASKGALESARKAYDAFDAIWVQSPAFAADLREIGCKSELRTIPYMAEPLPRLEEFPEGPIRIGFLGRLVSDKNPKLLINSFFEFARQYNANQGFQEARNIFLEIFGDGPLRRELEEEAGALGLGRNIRFHGSIPQREVTTKIAGCHLFVFTSDVEGQCLAALEILSCGRPIVATNAGAFPEILNDDRFGYLVNSRKPQDVAEAIFKLTNHVTKNTLSANIIQGLYRARLGPDVIGAQYMKLIYAFK